MTAHRLLFCWRRRGFPEANECFESSFLPMICRVSAALPPGSGTSVALEPGGGDSDALSLDASAPQ